MNDRQIRAALEIADLIDLHGGGKELYVQVEIGLRGKDAKIAQKYVKELERQGRAEERERRREHKRRMKTDPEYRRLMTSLKERTDELLSPAPRGPFVGRLFGDATLKAFDEEIAKEAVELQIERADELATGWWNAFHGWIDSQNDIIKTAREIDIAKGGKWTEEQRQGVIVRTERQKVITQAAQRRFFHTLAVAMRGARDDVADWVEHEYPDDPEGKFIAQEIRDVREPLDFAH